MKWNHINALLAVGVVLVGGIWFIGKLVRREESPGFREVVRNPELFAAFESQFEQAKQAELEAQQWSQAQVDAVVRSFVFVEQPQASWLVGRILRSLGSRTHAELLRILGDPAKHASLIKERAGDLGPTSPFRRVCELLQDAPPSDAVDLIAPFLSEPSDHIREHAAVVLGAVGTPNSIKPLQRALLDSDSSVCNYAMRGLWNAQSAGKLDAASQAILFQDLKRIVIDSEAKAKSVPADWLEADSAAGLMLSFNRDQAIQIFTDANFFRAQNDILHLVIKALVEQQVKSPRDQLLELITSLSSMDIKYPQTYSLGEALTALGLHRNLADKDLLERCSAHPERIVAESAAAGLIELHGLQGFKERLSKACADGGGTDEQRLYEAVFLLDAEVCNGGFSQYFFNSWGGDWQLAVRGLEAIGSTERLALTRQAIAKFGASGPSTERSTRMTQLAGIERAEKNPFEALESRYYKSTEPFHVLLLKYVITHPDEFR